MKDELYIPDYTIRNNSYVQEVGCIVLVGYINQLSAGARVALVATVAAVPTVGITASV